jgi:acyl carrier protein
MDDSETPSATALKALYAAIDELNPELASDKQLIKDPAGKLFGDEGGLESIDLVRLIVSYEFEIADATDLEISISDDRAMSDTQSHFSTVGGLAEYAADLIAEERDAG